MTQTATFPIDLTAFKPLALDPKQPTLSDEQRETLAANIQLCRETIVFFTAIGGAKGLGGHTGGPFDTVPETLIAHAFMLHAKESGSDDIVPIFWDEAGHRVGTQYLMSVLEGAMPAERLLHYREFNEKLPGHPELGLTPGVKFSSGRLGHVWPFVNGVAMAHPGKSVFMLGSDGSQMEGNDAEAARMAAAQNLSVKLVIDDNDVTIAGHPSDYLPGFDVAKTLEGHGIPTDTGDGEDLGTLYTRMAKAFSTDGPIALINKRPMCPGIDGLEGSNHGHDVIKTETAIAYLEKHGQQAAADFLKNCEKNPKQPAYPGSSTTFGKNRDLFGKVVCEILEGMPKEERIDRVRVIDSDLEGSCGLVHIHKAFPEVYVSSGIMERTNYSAAAGFGMESHRQGIFGTFSAFLEMCISEITMARLNKANVLAHFSHAGVDDMADNTCHFGLNNCFADNGLDDEGGDLTRLYFPADVHQMTALVKRIFWEKGLRFVFSTRSAVPEILGSDGKPMYAADGYEFVPGKDEVVREGSAGYVVSFGETLYRALGAVERLREEGIDVGLINKPTLNMIDEASLKRMGETGFVVAAESFNQKTGLGSRLGTWLLERGYSPKYKALGTHKEGSGGLWRQMAHQGLDPDGIYASVKSLL